MLPAIFRNEPILWPLLILLATIYIIPRTSIPERVVEKVHMHIEQLPDIKVDLHPSRTFRNRYSTNKTALYIETRNEIAHVTPLLLHMTQIIPPEWRFVFLGTESLISGVNRSSAVQRMVQTGKLRLGHIERWTNNWKLPVDVHETHSRLLTNLTFYDEQLPGVEWLLNFRSSAIVCASANRTINDYLDYDWVGAPWNVNDNFGGNGGLSLRRLSKVREVLKFQTRLDGVDSEDRWMSKRLGLLPGANCANGTVEKGFSVEDVWSEQPLGYHINPTLIPGSSADVWDNIAKRKEIYRYCPEIKMIMHMRLERERCPVEVAKPTPAPAAPAPVAPIPAAPVSVAPVPAAPVPAVVGLTAEELKLAELKKIANEAVNRWQDEQKQKQAEAESLKLAQATMTKAMPLATGTSNRQVAQYITHTVDPDGNIIKAHEDTNVAQLNKALSEDAKSRVKSDTERTGSKVDSGSSTEHWALDNDFKEAPKQSGAFAGSKMLHDT